MLPNERIIAHYRVCSISERDFTPLWRLQYRQKQEIFFLSNRLSNHLYLIQTTQYNDSIPRKEGTRILLRDYEAIGARLQMLRKRTGLTQAQVAEAAEISNRTYADIERGHANMHIETLLRICSVLHITPDQILTDDAPDNFPDPDVLFNRLSRCRDRDRVVALRTMEAYLNSLLTK